MQCDVTYNGEADPYTFKNLLSATLARTGGPGITLAGVALVALGCVAFALHKRTTGRSERHEKVDR